MKENGSAKRIARVVALGALFIVPLVPLIVSNSFFFPFITGKAFFFRIVVEIAVAAWLVLAFLDKRYRPRFSWIMLAALAFVVWMGIADAFALNAAKAFSSNFERMEGWILLIHLLGFFFAASAVLRVEKKWRTWFLISLGVGVLVSIHGFLQLLDPSQFPIHQGSTRIDSSFGNSAYFAIYLLFNAFISLWLAVTEKKYAWLKYALIAFAVIEVFLLFMTETRGTVLGLIGALLLSCLLFAITSGKRVRRAAIGVFILIGVISGGIYLARNSAIIQHDHVLQRITSISLSDGVTRFTIWHMAFEGFTESPKTVVFGWGQEGFNYIFNKYYEPSLYTQEQWFDRAHNAFIDWLTAGGAPAFLFYLALFVSALFFLWKGKDFTRSERIFLTAALVGYACHNFFVFDNLYSYIYFFIILAFIDARVGRPIAAFERWPELTPSAGALYALPIGAVAALVMIGALNVPGMRASAELIKAITPPRNGDYSQNLATFTDLVQHPSFAKQEIREQLVEFAMNVAQSQNTPAPVKQQFVSLAITEMQKQVQSYPFDARERLQLSYAYAAGGDVKDAVAQLKAAEALSPDKESIWMQEGITEMNAGNMQAAKAAFDRAYALGPEFSGIAPYAAAGDVVNGDIPAAHAILQNAFGTTTVDSDILSAAYYLAKDWPDLIALWQLRVTNALHAYAALPTDNNGSTATSMWFGLATVYYASGDSAKAIATADAIAAQFPQYASVVQTFVGQVNKKMPLQ